MADNPQGNSNTYLRGGGDRLSDQPICPQPTQHTSHTACTTQHGARDNNMHVGGGGQWAAIQLIQPFLAISAHLCWVNAHSLEAETRAQKNPQMYLRGGGQLVIVVKHWSVSNPPWPYQHTPPNKNQGGTNRNVAHKLKMLPRDQKCCPDTKNVTQI
jgi:hypothetical protein